MALRSGYSHNYGLSCPQPKLVISSCRQGAILLGYNFYIILIQTSLCDLSEENNWHSPSQEHACHCFFPSKLVTFAFPSQGPSFASVTCSWAYTVQLAHFSYLCNLLNNLYLIMWEKKRRKKIIENKAFKNMKVWLQNNC